MKKKAIIPIFVPHIGCTESCVFCDQKQITAREKAPSEEEVRKTIDTWLSTLLNSGEELEIAFYGGSFTAIPLSMQQHYLSIAKEYLDKGLVSSLHLSTRPDCISPEILDLLKDYGVKTIELGVQSFDDKVLEKSKRGHNSDTVREACQMIKDAGFDLGIQLMIGLPGDSYESCIYSANETVKLMPKLARLYPCLVLQGTELMEMYRTGDYIPLSREEALSRTKEMYRILEDAGIYIMRVGLKSTDIINSKNLGEINQGTYHPAFRELVEGELAKEEIQSQIDMLLTRKKDNSKVEGSIDSGSSNPHKARLVISCHPESMSLAAGHEGVNREYFAKRYPEFTIGFQKEETLPRGRYKVTMDS
ncbi:MAG: radical SAM protein [Firmicutes bacterium]|nr:radical SAM protein [Bacillota bacterium]